jgi:diguanylate cyclase (GGDEF)-like protein/PAS domain S-box-containing protein
MGISMEAIDLTRQRSHPVYQMVALLEELGEAVAVTDRFAHLIHINLSAQRMLGIVGEAVIGSSLGKWIDELAAAVDVEQTLADYAMIPGGQNAEKTATLRHLNGSLSQVRCVVCRVTFDDEAAFICMFRDQTEVSRVTEQMVDAQRLVRSILQNTSEGYVLIDASGMITDTNPAFEAMCGRNAMDLLDNRFDRLFDGRNRRIIDALVTKLEKGRNASAEISFQGTDGKTKLGLFKGAPLFDGKNERVGIFGLITDITEAKEKERKIEQLAYFDPLTELANRSLLRDKLEQATIFSQRSKRKFALLFLDLDRFKRVNDTYNHPLGDQVLQEVAMRIRQVVRRSDVVSRFGGDEFVIGLVEPKRIEDVALVAEKLLEIVAQPLGFDNHVLHITTSIGISVFPDDASSVDELIRNADLAMYQAKEEGRARYRYFTETLNARVRRQRELERQMWLAIENDEFILHYQPKVDGATGRIIGAEALIRWQNPTLGFISPADFIPLAEETGMIVPIGAWVLRHVSQQVQEWKRQGLPLVPVAVNVSGMQLHHPEFKQQLEELVAKSDLVTEWLELEITESTLMKDVELTISLLHDLCGMGFLLSVDDFGTGYSSFSYLTRFPIHILKIDQSFVRDLPNKRDAIAIVSAIAGMAKNLGLKTVAEGVETREQAEYLTNLGCDQLQGYFYSRPVPAADFAELLKAGVITP